MKKNLKTAASALLLVLVCALVLGLTGCSSGAAVAVPAAQTAEEITVSASGTVRIVPDKVTVTFGVTTQEETAALAQSGNTEAVNNVIEVLTAHGVEEKSIRTVNYNMYPQYDYSYDGKDRIVGYTVYATMSVQDQDIDGLGDLLAACVEAGINNVDNVTFLCSGYDEAYLQALTKALAASREKAEALAGAAGKAVDEAVSITEGWQDTSARYGYSVNTYKVFAQESAADSAAGPSLQPGESEVTANITVTYRMK